MKNFVILLSTSFMLMTACQTRRAILSPGPLIEQKKQEQKAYAPHTLIISYDVEVGKEPLLEAAKKMHSEVIYDYQNFNMLALRVPDKTDIQKAIRKLEKVKGVLQVNRDQIMHLDGHTESKLVAPGVVR